jgi:hypothetical protein
VIRISTVVSWVVKPLSFKGGYSFLGGASDSSVSIVSDYGLDRANEVRSLAEVKDFSSRLYVQTGTEVHSASCATGIGSHFPEGKARPGFDADHHLHLVPRS